MAGHVLIEPAALHVLELHQQHAGGGPFAELVEANFADIGEVLDHCGQVRADALLADLGVASTQLDDPRRGLSFQADGPLDMRLGGEGPTAADLVNSLGEGELADLIYRYGEERFSRRIAP